MREILTQAGAELRIVKNADGTVTARIGMKEAIFNDFAAAVEWACAVRDGERDE